MPKKSPKKKDEAASPFEAVRAKYGEGAIFTSTSLATTSEAVVPTGSLTLDRALGIGGLPLGRIIELYGPASAGKTTLALHVMAEAQKEGIPTFFIDAEHAFDPTYAEAIGVNLSELAVSQPSFGEEALGIAEAIIQAAEEPMVIAIDSVAALTPKAEIEGEIEQSQPGVQARMMSKALRKLCAIANQKKVMVLFINQIRMKIGVMFGSPETTTGGRALPFYASIRLDIRRKASLKEGETVVGQETKVKVTKNKCAPPFREALFDISYGRGIDQNAETLDLAVQKGVLKRSGAWYSQGDEKLANGRKAMLDRLQTDDKLREALREAIT